MKLKNKTELMIVIGAVISLIFAFIYPSISIGLLTGFAFCYVNYKLVYKNLDMVMQAQQTGKIKTSFLNQAIRFGLLMLFVYITVHFPQYFNIIGIGIGMALALVGSVLDSKKVDNG